MAKSKSKKRRKIIVFCLLILLLGGLGAAALLRKNERVVTVQTEKVQHRDITETVVANGRIYPVFQVPISPEVSGEIIELPVKEGRTVKKGDLLLKIKAKEYVARRNSSEASYKSSLAGKLSSTANLKKARLEYERIKSLHDTDLVSQSEFLTAATNYEIAKAQLQISTHQVEMAEAALRQADEDLAKTTIVSPCDGTISKLNSRLGERVVGTGMMAGTQVMIIADLNEMEARVDIGEIDIVLIEVGQKTVLEVDAFKDREFTGRVSEIANSSKGLGLGGGTQSQEATKFEVKILIEDTEAFRPGMTVTSEIETRSHTNVIAVPIASVTTRMPKPDPENEKSKPGAPTTSTTNETTSAEASLTETNQTESTSEKSEASQTASDGKDDKSGKKKDKNGKQDGEKVRPVEVVFVKEGDRAKMLQVKLGISDDTHWEITEGLEEGQEVISGGYKAISRDLEDGMKVKIGLPGGAPDARKSD